MNNVTPFVPKSDLIAKAALKEYVYWAKSQTHCYDKPLDPLQWMAMSWHRWGLRNTVCSKLGNKSEILHPDFIDYAKAVLFDERSVKCSEDKYTLFSLRCLEAALLALTKKGDVTAVTAAVFDRACAIAQNHYDAYTTAYGVSLRLKKISDHLHEIGVVIRPFIWSPQIKCYRETLEKSAEFSLKKLPSDKSLMALGEIFNNKPDLPLDIMVTSAVAIMLSQPCRISELSFMKKDCLFMERDAQGREQLYMLWHSAKGFGENQKIIPDSMAEICQEAVRRVIKVTQDSRKYAKWIEENPEQFPPHENVPKKKLDEPLSTKEVCDALMISVAPPSSRGSTSRWALKKYLKRTASGKNLPFVVREIAQKILDGYDDSKGTRYYVDGRLNSIKYNDTFKVTLRVLNVFVRKKYLNEHFPYTNNKKITKWQDALFCFNTGSFDMAGTKDFTKPFGLIGPVGSRLTAQLTGSSKKVKSIFERYGYSETRVNTHAFRHYLNTGANRANLSQELIARWSGRVDVTQNRVYNHMSAEDKADEIEKFTPQYEIENFSLLESLKTNVPVRIKDLDLGESGDRIVHFTEFGVCTHDYAQEPCAKFNNCLTCGEHVCVKGDDKKLENIRDEREYLRSSLEAFQREADEGTYGANTWLKTTMEKMERCDQLIKMLENPDVEDGAIIKGRENRWTVGRNALAMRGELEEEEASLITTDKMDDQADELERLLGLGN